MKFIQEKIIIACGVLLLVLPFTGFPRSWKTFISVLVGVVVVYFGALMYRKAVNSVAGMSEKKSETFTETI